MVCATVIEMMQLLQLPISEPLTDCSSSSCVQYLAANKIIYVINSIKFNCYYCIELSNKEKYKDLSTPSNLGITCEKLTMAEAIAELAILA